MSIYTNARQRFGILAAVVSFVCATLLVAPIAQAEVVKVIGVGQDQSAEDLSIKENADKKFEVIDKSNVENEDNLKVSERLREPIARESVSPKSPEEVAEEAKAQIELEKKEEAEAQQRLEEQKRQEQLEKEQQAAQERAEAAAAESASSSSGASSAQDVGAGGPYQMNAAGAKAAFEQISADYGVSSSEKDCWATLIAYESGWNPNAKNASSGAYGLPQALPGSKMASAGSDWQTNPYTQLKWMHSYVMGRYGSFKNALDHFNSRNWY